MKKEEFRLEPETNCVLNFEQTKAKYFQQMMTIPQIRDMFDQWHEVFVQYDSEVDTLRHIRRVNELLLDVTKHLIERAQIHDESKLHQPEKECFDRETPILKSLTYGSEEYKESLKRLKVGLDHHYKFNSHHPEHYEKGVNGMNLLDLIEMLVDWKAATERHADGDIQKSLQINKDRFKMSDQLVDVFQNTIGFLKYF